MTFATPLALLALVAIPLAIAGYVLLERGRTRTAERFAAAAMLPNVVERAPGWRRHIPFAVFLLALTAMLVGIARPHAALSVKRQQATVVVAIDTSRSMAARDVAPTRLDAARATIRRFLEQLPKQYRVGIVSFASTAQVVAPATANRELVDQALDELRPGAGTALGDAIASAVQVAKSVPAEANAHGRTPAASILLISDGAPDGGRISPAEALRRAAAAHIPISTVALGTPDGIVVVPHSGGFVERIRVPPNPAALRTIAKRSGGRFFTDSKTVDLSSVYRELGSRVGKVNKNEEITVAFAGGAAVLMLIGAALSTGLLRRLP